MKVILFKDNNQVDEVDLSLESKGLEEDVSYLMGRSPKCHLVLDDHQVSREHVKIDFKGGDWFLNLLSDYGGLIVNGSPTQNKKIENGDIAKVGPYTVHFYIPPKVVETPIPAPQEEAPPKEEESKEEKDDVTEVIEEGKGEEGEGEEGESIDGESSLDDSEDSFGGEGDSSDDEFSSNDEEDEYGSGGGDDEYSSDSGSDEYGSGDDEYGDSGGGFDDDGDGGGFGDDGDDDDFGGGDDDAGTLVFSSFAKYELELFGEYAPYDKFILEDPEVFIGRDPEKCKIILQDPEVSSVHAVIKKNNITCSIEDLKSANGTILNGERINKSVLSNNDEFIIGGTTFTVKVVSELLDQESDRLMPVEENQEIEIEEVVEVDSSFGEDEDAFGEGEDFEGEEGGETFGEAPSAAPEEKSLIKKIMKDPAKRKKAIIYGSVLVALGVMLYEPAPPKKKTVRRVASKKADAKKGKKKKTKKSYSEKTRAFLTQKYQVAEVLYNKKEFDRAIRAFDEILEITEGEDWNNTLFYKKLAQQNMAKLEEEVRKLEQRKENEIRKAKVKELVDKAKDAVDKMESMRAESLFSKILELEPDNFDVPQLRIELESKAAEIREKEADEQRKREERAEKVDALKPGETLFLQKIWYKAIARLEQFMKIDDMDEDLLKKAAEMLAKSKKELDDAMGPLKQKVERLKEGQDLKGAYDILSQMNELDPTDEKVLNEMASIRETLELRARKIYREGLISESLSLFQEAKEKFEDVKGTAPIGSSYYKKAIDKLKEY